MAKTAFRVINLNPDFEIPAGSGFWFRANSTGGVNTAGTVDPADDTVVPAGGMSNNGQPGIWVFISPADLTSTVGDTVNLGTPLEKFESPTDFFVDGDATAPHSTAGQLFQALLDETFIWLPKNPEYNTVAPLLKDGVTANPDFDNTGNPFLADGVTRADVTSSVCAHFTVETLVV